ncbi:carbohydrate sulfotransferase 10-like [Penaeus chinensis]|uniref:carbohydrate sulfotransferase 10-like n=1 Tax=Penaeus chinensis TaxID=139456 RepID=UPI001FB5D3A2|nr:carbohydrate sulfotransferase 10-like [Penaeus chinensis]
MILNARRGKTSSCAVLLVILFFAVNTYTPGSQRGSSETDLSLLFTSEAVRPASECMHIKKNTKPKSSTSNHIEPDLHETFRTRREHLLEQCRRLNLTAKYTNKDWLWSLLLEFPGPLDVCLPPKVGSTSWRELQKRVSERELSGLHPSSAILVRHPLSRLTSAYRDKYLDGAPISDYDKNWRKSQGFTAPRFYYWYNYWIPTLISSGRLVPSEEFLKRVKDGRSIHRTRSVGIANLRDAVMDIYGSKDLQKQFSNATFTFREFLEFILWVDELGMRDLHWGTYTEQCLPCQEDYQYILHLETVDAESRVLLQDVGYPEDIRLATKHRTKGLSHTLSTNDLEYYKNLPKGLLNRILKFYEYDFDLFGYSKDILAV